MNINPEIMLNVCHWTAFTLVIALPFVLPGCLAALGAASALYTLTWCLRFCLRLWRLPVSSSDLKPLLRGLSRTAVFRLFEFL